MKHLDAGEYVDWLEGRLPAARLAHADTCDACRRQADALAAMLGDVRDDRAHEPSPLFWDHFAARVAEAIRDQAPAPAAAPWSWVRSPATAWATSASIAVLLLVTALWRATLVAPVPRHAGVATPVTSGAPAAVAADDIELDEAWAVVRAAAAEWQWEDAHAAGISAHPGSSEGVALELTADERTELARLLDAEMKQNEASEGGL